MIHKKALMYKEESLKEHSKILFIALNGIGNLILLTPAFTNIKKNIPESKISVLTLSDSAGVITNNHYVDEVIIYPAKWSFFLRITFLLSLRGKKFDVSFYPYPNVSIMSATMSFLIGAKCKVNFYYKLMNRWCGFLNTISVPVDTDKHDVEKNLDSLRILNLKIYSKDLFIHISEEDRKYVDILLKNKLQRDDILIGMHVGSKEGMRIWPTENFAALVGKLLTYKKIKIVLIGTGIEMDLIRNFDQFKHPNIINLIRKTTIPQTTALIRKCKLFITTDSGPMHMAVAAGTKVIAIYLGPHIKRTAPFGTRHMVFLTNMATINEDKNKNHIYVDEVTPDMVFNEIKKSLNL